MVKQKGMSGVAKSFGARYEESQWQSETETTNFKQITIIY
jgi:hypothetical protein